MVQECIFRSKKKEGYNEKQTEGSS